MFWCLASKHKPLHCALDMQWNMIQRLLISNVNPRCCEGNPYLEIENIQIKAAVISTLDSPCIHSPFPLLNIHYVHYLIKLSLCFSCVFHLCQQRLCSNIYEICPLTKALSLPAWMCTGFQQVEWAMSLSLLQCSVRRVAALIALIGKLQSVILGLYKLNLIDWLTFPWTNTDWHARANRKLVFGFRTEIVAILDFTAHLLWPK